MTKYYTADLILIVMKIQDKNNKIIKLTKCDKR